MHEEDKIGTERAVDEEFTAPMTIRMLLPKQIFLGARDRTPDLRIVGRISRNGIGKDAWQRDQVRG
jgi:hypothetical protein